MTNRFTWTDSQKLALDARKTNLLISAAAGSGKTAVLTERIARLLTEENNPLALDDLLAVTFTKSAAANLKEALYKALQTKQAENPTDRRIKKLLSALPRANISTVHSYCFKLVRENALSLGLNPKLRIADEAELSPLFAASAKEALELFFPSDIPPAKRNAAQKNALLLFSLFQTPSRNQTPETLLRILYEELRATEEGVPLLYHLCERDSLQHEDLVSGKLDFLDTPLGEVFAGRLERVLCLINAQLKDFLEAFPQDERNEKILPKVFVWQRFCSLLTGVLHQNEKGKLDALLSASDTLEKINYANKSKTIPTSSEEGERLKKSFANTIDLYTPFRTILDSFRSGEYEKEELQRLSFQKLVADFLIEFDRLYSARKRRSAFVDYQDLERFAYELLRQNRTACCKALFVDEYQDTNILQDSIFKLLVGDGDFFFVGDIKQSIYRFRYASPELFLGYKNNYRPYEEGCGERNGRISLSDNFRSDSGVIHCVNEVFDTLMNDSTDPLLCLYPPEDRLKFHKETDALVLPEFYLLDTAGETSKKERALGADAEKDEIGLVLQKTVELLREGYAPDEIAVLAYNNAFLKKLRDRARRKGIPVAYKEEENVLQTPEVLYLCAVLGAIDNPLYDIDFAALLTGPLFSFSSAQLAEIREFLQDAPYYQAFCAYVNAKDNELSAHAREVLSFLSRLRVESRKKTCAELILSLLRTECLLDFFDADLQSDSRQNLLSVYEKARSFERGARRPIREFLNYLQKNASPAEDARTPEPSCVQLLTVHRSKGLEFRACIFAQLGHSFRKEESNEAPYFFSKKNGLFFRYWDEEHQVFKRLISREIAGMAGADPALEEQKRVLYVGMTRAKERLILLCAPPSSHKPETVFSRTGFDPLRTREAGDASFCKSAYEFLLYALRNNETFRKTILAYYASPREKADIFCDNFLLHLLPYTAIDTNLSLRKQNENENTNAPFAPEELEALERSLEAEKALRTRTLLPSKVSVSELAALSDEQERSLRSRLSLRREELDAAARGVAVHSFLQFADYQNCEIDLVAEAARLVERGFITELQAQSLNFAVLLHFFESETYRKLKESPRVSRELRFNVFLPANELFETEDEKRVLVQGVVDCFYENPDGTISILDFKTDALPQKKAREVLLSRHAKQLSVYRRAVEEITGKQVSSLALYALSIGEEVPVPIES